MEGQEATDIFDEASQIEVAEAIGAMGRARSVVVVGDSNQMPPSRFAEVGGDDDFDTFDTDVVDDAESLLGEAVDAGMDREWLSWHYRSRDESLIAFSNAHYYEGRLSSFPSPGQRARPALRWQRVQGLFEHGGRRVNEIEAQAVVAEIVRRLREDPSASIGVVTLNVQQANEIIERLHALGDPLIMDLLASDHPEALFVRNLENVQGDERDVIILSTGFSRTKTGGPMPLRFGPLNRAGGERRLNVAVTRAREEVLVISSFDPEEIDERRATALGLIHLRTFLQVARDGARPVEDVASVRGRRSAFREAVARALEDRGLTIASNVGLSPFRVDLAVIRPDTPSWAVAVLLDGWRWRDRVTVGDRDALPIVVLKREMGWPAVVRIWTPAWRHEADAIVDDIVAHVDASLSRPQGSDADPHEPHSESEDATEPSMVPPRRDGNEIDDLYVAGHGNPPTPLDPVTTATVDDASAADLEPTVAPGGTGDRWHRFGATEFEPYPETPSLGVPSDCDPGTSATAALQEALAAAIEWEAPVEAVRLARLVSRRLQVEKLHGKRAEHILRHLPSGATVRRTKLGRFVWGPDQHPSEYPEFRTATEALPRKLEEVAPEEIANLLHAIVRASHQIDRDELYRTGLGALGIARLTTGFRRRLDNVVASAVASDRFTLVDTDRVALGHRHGDFPVAPPRPTRAAASHVNRERPAPSVSADVPLPDQRTSETGRHDAPTGPSDAEPPSDGRPSTSDDVDTASQQPNQNTPERIDTLAGQRGLERCGAYWYELVALAIVTDDTTDASSEGPPTSTGVLLRLQDEKARSYGALKRFVKAPSDWLGGAETIQTMVGLMTAIERMIGNLNDSDSRAEEILMLWTVLRHVETETLPHSNEAPDDPMPSSDATAYPTNDILHRADVNLRRVVEACAIRGVTLEPLEEGPGTLCFFKDGDAEVLIEFVALQHLVTNGRPTVVIRLLCPVPIPATTSLDAQVIAINWLNAQIPFAAVMLDDEVVVRHEIPAGGGLVIPNSIATLHNFAITTRLVATALAGLK